MTATDKQVGFLSDIPKFYTNHTEELYLKERKMPSEMPLQRMKSKHFDGLEQYCCKCLYS